MPTKRVSLASLALVAALAACSTGEPGENELDRHLCAAADLDGDYIELTRGEFTPRDLADLSDDADARERQFEEAGMERGRFVFYKQVLPRPPFDPPMNVVCQAIQFGEASQAERYAAGLDADHPTLQVSGIAWLPEGARSVQDAGEGVHRIEVSDAGREVSVLVGVSTAGRTVVSVYLGSDGEAPTIEGLRAIQAKVAARTK